MNKFSLLCLGLAGAVFAEDMPKPELKFKGDVRFRGDWAYTELESGNSKFAKEGPNSERWLQAARARFGATYGQGNWTAGMRLVTGYGMPNTANQALGNSFVSKTISLDRAYITLNNKTGGEDTWLAVSDFTVGKMNSPFYRGKATQELIWHGETAPEGADWTVQLGSKSTKLSARVGRFWVEEVEKERKSSNTSTFVPDLFLQSQQAQLEIKQELFSIRIGGGTHYYNDLKGHRLLGLDSTKAFGNTSYDADTSKAVTSLAYSSHFNLAEGFVDLGFKVMNAPVTLGAGMVRNLDVDGENASGFMVGAKFGEAKKKGQLEIGYGFRQMGADGIIGVTSSSDLNAYSTNSRGQVVSLRYMLTDNLSYDLMGHIANTVGITDADQGKEQYFNRIRTELNASF